MIGRFVRFNALLSTVVLAGSAYAQNSDLSFKWPIILSDGPYEVKDESGVIGFVVASTGEMVTFKPCIGDSFPLDRKKLLKTTNKCGDSPSPDENPLVANCEKALKILDATKIAQATNNNEPIGTAFFPTKGNTEMTATRMSASQMAAAIDDAAQLFDCGKFVVGFDKGGEVKLNLIRATNSVPIDN